MNYKYQWTSKQFLDGLLRNSSFNNLNSFYNLLLHFTRSPHLCFILFIQVKAKYVRHKIPKKSVVRIDIQQRALIYSNYKTSAASRLRSKYLHSAGQNPIYTCALLEQIHNWL